MLKGWAAGFKDEVLAVILVLFIACPFPSVTSLMVRLEVLGLLICVNCGFQFLFIVFYVLVDWANNNVCVLRSSILPMPIYEFCYYRYTPRAASFKY